MTTQSPKIKSPIAKGPSNTLLGQSPLSITTPISLAFTPPTSTMGGFSVPFSTSNSMMPHLPQPSPSMAMAQHPFTSPLSHPHPLIHNPYFAAAAHAMHPYHTHPFATPTGFPYHFPYGGMPYGALAQPPHSVQAQLPAPQSSSNPHSITPSSTPVLKPTSLNSLESTTLHHHHSSSSSTLTRSLREVRETTNNDEIDRQTLETTMTHHQQTSHHSSIHADKSNFGPSGSNATGPITFSHSTSTSSSQSVSFLYFPDFYGHRYKNGPPFLLFVFWKYQKKYVCGAKKSGQG